jgi:23S rRNA (uracil1939-C5)-methyltransferase
MNINDVVRLNIVELNQNGHGIAYYNGLSIIIPNTLPNEVIDAKIVEIASKMANAQVVNLVQASNLRINPPCQYFTRCGGCSIQHLSNHGEYKHFLLKQALTELNFNAILHPIIQIAESTRRRVNFKVSNKRLSLTQYRSNITLAIGNCLLLENKINNLIVPINKLINKLDVLIESLSITSSDTGIELLFHSNQKSSLTCDLSLAEFAKVENIARIAWQNSSHTPYSIIQYSPMQLIINQVRIDLPINSFLQVSKDSTKLMGDIILNHLETGKTILELYCGCGSFSIPISSKGSVFAIEGSEEAIIALNKAALNYNLPIKAIKQDLYQNPLLSKEINKYSQVVINPPRNGATPQIRQISQAYSVKTVILISCSLINFIRDAKILLDTGFSLVEVYSIDQFLYTTHLEIIGIFKRP